MMGEAGKKPRKDTPHGRANPAARPAATMHARMVSCPPAIDFRDAADRASTPGERREKSRLLGTLARRMRHAIRCGASAGTRPDRHAPVNDWIRSAHKM
jgi:hypothetical protein